MAVRNLSLDALTINRANDRHGELENETAAIAWLFNSRERHMKNLAKDIAEKGQIFELPLVSPDGGKFLVFDGNRRVTCLKLLKDPKRAPTVELQAFFKALRLSWNGSFPGKISCQVVFDRDTIDDILFRRHTGSQSGVGQSTWDDRMKTNFVVRSGKGSGLNVADEIEDRLAKAELLPSRKIPRSTLNRLLSAEAFRNRLGFSIQRGRFKFTHQEDVSLTAMARVARDLANKRIVLGKIWDVDGKRGYLDELEHEGVLPTALHSLAVTTPQSAKPQTRKSSSTSSAKKSDRHHLIPDKDFNLTWPGRLQRHHQIWEELQFHLELKIHQNAISVLFRVLIELSIENYIERTGLLVQPQDKFRIKFLKIGENLYSREVIDKKQLGVIKKFQNADNLISADTLNRYVHSPNFAPSPEHLTSMWDTLSEIIIVCLDA
jgi:hypothetical protein